MNRVNATLPPICFTAGNTLIACGLWGPFSIPFLALAGIGAVDTYFRWKEYVHLRQWFGEQERISLGLFNRVLARHRGSWCRRRLAIHASRAYAPADPDTTEEMARQFFELYGYRWWHILPDVFPRAFFTLAWWRGLVGR